MPGLINAIGRAIVFGILFILSIPLALFALLAWLVLSIFNAWYDNSMTDSIYLSTCVRSPLMLALFYTLTASHAATP